MSHGTRHTGANLQRVDLAVADAGAALPPAPAPRLDAAVLRARNYSAAAAAAVAVVVCCECHDHIAAGGGEGIARKHEPLRSPSPPRRALPVVHGLVPPPRVQRVGLPA